MTKTQNVMLEAMIRKNDTEMFALSPNNMLYWLNNK